MSLELAIVAYAGICLLVFAVWRGGEVLTGWLAERRQRRIVRIEADLDRQAMELRSTIFTLAAQLSGDAHEARKALIRESYLASGKAPEGDK